MVPGGGVEPPRY